MEVFLTKRGRKKGNSGSETKFPLGTFANIFKNVYLCSTKVV